MHLTYDHYYILLNQKISVVANIFLGISLFHRACCCAILFNISKKNFFCSLKPYHKLASRKKQNILQKFKEQAIDNVSSYDTYILCYLQFFKVGKVTTWVKYG